MNTRPSSAVRLGTSDRVLVIEIHNPPINSASLDARRGILDAVGRLAGSDDWQAKDGPVLDATASAGEILADVLMTGDAIASVPVVGLAVKALRARDSFRDALFTGKTRGEHCRV